MGYSDATSTISIDTATISLSRGQVNGFCLIQPPSSHILGQPARAYKSNYENTSYNLPTKPLIMESSEWKQGFHLLATKLDALRCLERNTIVSGADSTKNWRKGETDKIHDGL